MKNKKDIIFPMFFFLLIIYVFGYLGIKYLEITQPLLHKAITNPPILKALIIFPISYILMILFIFIHNHIVRKGSTGKIISIGPYASMLLVLHLLLSGIIIFFSYMSITMFGNILN